MILDEMSCHLSLSAVMAADFVLATAVSCFLAPRESRYEHRAFQLLFTCFAAPISPRSPMRRRARAILLAPCFHAHDCFCYGECPGNFAQNAFWSTFKIVHKLFMATFFQFYRSAPTPVS